MVFLPTIAGAAAAVFHFASVTAVGETINETDNRHLGTNTHAERAWENQQLYQGNKPSNFSTLCSVEDTAVRREWSMLSKSEKKEYIEAVQCLGRLEAKTPSSKAPGVRRRYDDFVATHINQTFSVHNTGNFFGWHRYLVWAYEKALREECGYDGYQPYYNWPMWAEDPQSSPALDGSETSMSGNGELGCLEQEGYGIPTNAKPNIVIPHGNGGGCLRDGPFKDFGMNLGPVMSDLTCVPPNPISGNISNPLNGLGYNPRCIKRDISPWTSSQWTNDDEVKDLLDCDSISCFWYNMQGGNPPFTNNFMGVHTAGHFTIGGDPGSDFVASNGDPWFYLHHAQIDRIWWIWQNQHPLNRTNAIYGTLTLANSPPSRNATLDDHMDLGFASDLRMTLGESMDTMGGPFCYRYE